MANCQGNYRLRYYNCKGVYQFDLVDVESVQLSRKKNDLGIMVITLDGTQFEYDQFNQDDRVEVYRNGKLLGQTVWFLRKVEININSNCDEQYVLTFYDTIHLLTRRIVAYDGEETEQFPSHLRERLDDMIKYIFYFNLGEGTDGPLPIALNTFTPTSPVFTILAGDAYESWQLNPYGGVLANRAFPIQLQNHSSQSNNVQTHRFELIPVLTAMQDIANLSEVLGESLWFDIEYTPATNLASEVFVFKTWVGARGSDRSSGANRVIVGPEFGNMTNAVLLRDWENEKTIMYAAGDNDNNLKNMGFARRDSPDCPFYPIEGITSESGGEREDGIINTHLLPTLQTAALIGLEENKFIEALTGTIINEETVDFFENLQYGDIVLAQYKDFVQAVEIREFEINIDSTGEELTLPLQV